MLKSERRSSIDKSFGLMFQSKAFMINKFDPEPEEGEGEEGDEGGANNPPPPVPPVSGN